MHALVHRDLIAQFLIGDGAQRYLILEVVGAELSPDGKSDIAGEKSDIGDKEPGRPRRDLPHSGKSREAERCQIEARDLPKAAGESCQNEFAVQAKSKTSISHLKNVSGDSSGGAADGGALQARPPSSASRYTGYVEQSSSERLEGADDEYSDALEEPEYLRRDHDESLAAVDTNWGPDDANADAPSAHAGGDRWPA